ncbi:hypothetical protein FJY68_09005 [candidate division WOR-3 bacterium]|uniref:Uncharacterized protein n=1 Tax=candidate division WOR-3 bacterium TaxID=2052148 RepID=A0A937XHY9_UNCW3|nr:hypothetical protein [candidate division WOR-3 bacterium]
MTPELRIDGPERQKRRLRRTGTAALMVAISAGLLATSCAPGRDAAQPKVVTGTEFRLVDDKGATHAVLALENGAPLLRFLDEKGKSRAVVGLQEYGPSLFFARDNGKPGTSIGVGPTGPAMAFGDSSGNMRILLTVDSTGAPRLMLRDTSGHTAWTAPEPTKR